MNHAGVFSPEEAAKIERISVILKSIAHPLRLGIVHLLEQNESLTVNQICHMLDSEQSLTSHHLQNLRETGLISVQRKGRTMLYSLREKKVSILMECLEECQARLSMQGFLK